MDMNNLVVAHKDSKNKAVFNQLLLKAFNELGGAENNAVDTLDFELKAAGVDCKRKSIIGKLSIMGVKSITKPKVKKTAKKDDGPTKKELINTFLKLTGTTADDFKTLPNLKKDDVKGLIAVYEAILEKLEV